MKYLETNALRIFANQLEEDDFINDKYTSVLSLIELLSGINENKSFELRKSIIKKITKSKIKIDLILPEIRIYNAFGFKLNNSGMADKLGRIIKLIEVTKDYESLIKTININLLNDGWVFIKQYDKNANIGFKNSIIQRFQKSDIKNLIRQHKARWALENLNLLNGKVIEYFANILLKEKSIATKKSIPEIISSYNRSIDIYLLATAFYVDRKISFINTPGKNDYMDLSHLIYLNGKQNQIVTNDNMLHKIMKDIYPENILKTNEI
jgi:hypothetical protein